MADEIDIRAVWADHARYRELWEMAGKGQTGEVFAILAAAQAADRLPELITAVESVQAAYGRLTALHRPVQRDGRDRCFSCIAGFDPSNGNALVHCAWPCATWQAWTAADELPDWERELLERESR